MSLLLLRVNVVQMVLSGSQLGQVSGLLPGVWTATRVSGMLLRCLWRIGRLWHIVSVCVCVEHRMSVAQSDVCRTSDVIGTSGVCDTVGCP